MVLSVKNMKAGAGGLITGMDMHSDGTLVIRTDVFGAYIRDRTAANPGNAGGVGRWQQLVTVDSFKSEMGASGILETPEWLGDGVHEIRIAPSNSNILYMFTCNFMWVTYDRGKSWYRTSFSNTAITVNGVQYRVYRFKMAIDLLNSDVVHFATPSNGAFYSLDGGRSWKVPTGLATNDVNALSCVAIDPSSSTSNGRKNGVYVSISGTGLHKSTDGGLTYSAVGGVGQPTQINDLWVTDTGVVYVVNTDGKAYRLSGGTWTDITPSGASINALCIYPSNNLKVIVFPFQTGPQQTSNGTTVTPSSGWSAVAATPSVLAATDCPMLATLHLNSSSNGNLCPTIDPTDETKIWLSTQQGVFQIDAPPAASPSVITYTSVSAGIEEIVANGTFLSPGGYPPLLYGHDVGVIQQTDDTKYALSKVWNTTSFLTFGQHVDAAKSDPSYVAAAIHFQVGGSGNPGGFSLDGGSSWTAFSGVPADGGIAGGAIAVSTGGATTAKIIWQRANTPGQPWYTSDGGQNWSLISGLPTSEWWNSIFFNRIPVVADPNQSGRFLLQYGGTTGSGTYIVDNGTLTSSSANTIDSVQGNLVTGGSPSTGFNSGTLRAVPGHAGHFFWTVGPIGSGRSSVATDFPTDARLWFTSNYGVNWTDASGLSSNNFTIRNPWRIAIGAVKPGQSYPAIYLYGWIAAGASAPPAGSKPGVWASYDQGVTWSQIGPQHPTGWPDFLKSLDADPLVFGKIALGFSGSGWWIGNLTTSGGLRLGQVR